MGTSLYEKYKAEQEPKPPQGASLYRQYLAQKQDVPGVAAESTLGLPTDIQQREHSAEESFGDLVKGFGRMGLTGVTLGGGDEIMASMRAMMTDETVLEALNKERAAHSEFRERHPVGAAVTAGAAGLVPAAAANVVAPGLGMVGGGALFGGIYGANESEGLHDIAGSAAIGAGTGAAVGGLLKGGGKVGRVAYDMAKGASRAAAGSAPAQQLSKYIPVTAKQHARATGQPAMATAAKPTSGGAPPSAPPSVMGSFRPRSPEERAEALLLQRLGSDKVTLDQLESSIAATGKPVSISDVAGDNTLGLARGVRSLPGEGKQSIPKAIYDRAEGQGIRVRGDLEDAAGVKVGDVVTKADDLIAQRRANAQPLYDDAYNTPPIDDPDIRATVKLPQFQQAYKRAQRIAKAEGTKLPALKANQPFSVQSLDYVKRGMDDLIESKMRTGKMGRTEARALKKRLSDMLERIDDARPEYAAARKQFGSDSKAIDALEMGRQFSKTDGREVQRFVAGLSPGDRALYVQGALDDLSQAIRNRGDGLDVVSTVFGSDEKREALRALLGDNGFEVLAKAMGVEKKMLHTKRFTLGGSNTADKLAEQVDLDSAGIPQALLHFLRGNFAQGTQSLGSSVLLQRLQGVTEETANALAPKLIAGMNGDRKALAEVIAALRKAEQREAVRRATRNAASRPLTGMAGGGLSGAFNDRP